MFYLDRFNRNYNGTLIIQILLANVLLNRIDGNAVDRLIFHISSQEFYTRIEVCPNSYSIFLPDTCPLFQKYYRLWEQLRRAITKLVERLSS